MDILTDNKTESNRLIDNKVEILDKDSTIKNKSIVTTTDKELSVVPKIVYGWKIKKAESNPSTRVEYTDDAIGMTPVTIDLSTSTVDYGDWINTFIINSFKPCMLKFDGTVDYYLDRENQNYKEDKETLSDIDNIEYEGNAMVQVKKMYLYCYEDSNYYYCKISNIKVDSNYKCYAHINDNGQEVDYIYLPMFEGTLDSSNRIRSIADKRPAVSLSGSNEIQYCKNNGSRWYTDDFINTKLVENIIFLLVKSCNSQITLGRGFVDGNSSPCTTGTLINKGMFWGSSNGKVAVKFLYLENYYGSRWDRIAGLINNNGTYYIKPTRPYNDDGSCTNYINTGISVPGNGWQKNHKMTEYGLVPIGMGGSDSTYIPDFFWSNNSQIDYCSRGGYWVDISYCGLSTIILYDRFEMVNNGHGCSPCYK